jgi:hypothetical protein
VNTTNGLVAKFINNIEIITIQDKGFAEHYWPTFLYAIQYSKFYYSRSIYSGHYSRILSSSKSLNIFLPLLLTFKLRLYTKSLYSGVCFFRNLHVDRIVTFYHNITIVLIVLKGLSSK